ncbi:MAG: indole-3-glycerol phosphate synthase TrpC [Desulfobacterales bacterium]
MSTKDILSQIVEHKKKEIAEARKAVSEDQLREQAGVAREKRPFFDSLAHPGPSGVNIIAEIKRASPSKGIFSPDLDPVTTATAYEQGGAAALSVLTDMHYFKGSRQDLEKARAATGLPVLRKDFLISAYQLYEAAVMGADAVLLIVRILSAQQLKDYLSLAVELNMDALVEIHAPEDLDVATRSGARLIGINNRNLKSFDTDIQTAISMVSSLSSDQIPVAASGIHTPEDIERNLQSGIHNFLIGESLVKAPDTVAFIKALLAAGGNTDARTTDDT